MLPKKLLVFGLLLLVGINYLMKKNRQKQNQSKGQSKQVKKSPKKSKESKESKESIKVSDSEREELTKEGNKYIVGDCISVHKDGWEYTEILKVEKSDKTYNIVDCHKYKGCSEPSDVSWQEIENEYKQGRLVSCQK